MRPVTHHSPWGNFWLNIISERFPPTVQPWLGSVRFLSFSKLKTHLRGYHFGTVENVEAAATRALNNISSEDFLHCYEEWQQRWNRCIRSQGAYFVIACMFNKKIYFKSFSLLLGQTSYWEVRRGISKTEIGNFIIQLCCSEGSRSGGGEQGGQSSQRWKTKKQEANSSGRWRKKQGVIKE